MMNAEEILSTYENVVDLSEKMLSAARSGDWDRLIDLEANCAEQIKRLTAAGPIAPLSAEPRSKKIKIIHRILANDREIRELTSPWMARLSSMINSTGTQRRLTNAYGAV